jgi:hypothetical protein
MAIIPWDNLSDVNLQREATEIRDSAGESSSFIALNDTLKKKLVSVDSKAAHYFDVPGVVRQVVQF